MCVLHACMSWMYILCSSGAAVTNSHPLNILSRTHTPEHPITNSHPLHIIGVYMMVKRIHTHRERERERERQKDTRPGRSRSHEPTFPQQTAAARGLPAQAPPPPPLPLSSASPNRPPPEPYVLKGSGSGQFPGARAGLADEGVGQMKVCPGHASGRHPTGPRTCRPSSM